MVDSLLLLFFVLAFWWASTGLILYLDGLPRRSFRWSMLGATGLLAAALYGLALSGNDATPAGAALAFTCGLLVWGWNETAFLLGYLTGPRRVACPPGCTGLRRFGLATATLIHHELAIAASGAVILALTWHAPNMTGWYTFLLLWAMRLSSKLNVYLGVANTSAHFLPAHLAHLESYFGRKAINALFPVSATAATLCAAWLVHSALAAEGGSFEQAGATLLAALAVLGVLEHWLLVVPVRMDALWKWGLASRARSETVEEALVVTRLPR
jgi:putative photosynthetic complex assembly protein 2